MHALDLPSPAPHATLDLPLAAPWAGEARCPACHAPLHEADDAPAMDGWSPAEAERLAGGTLGLFACGPCGALWPWEG
jgi:hypothetical protein